MIFFCTQRKSRELMLLNVMLLYIHIHMYIKYAVTQSELVFTCSLMLLELGTVFLPPVFRLFLLRSVRRDLRDSVERADVVVETSLSSPRLFTASTVLRPERLSRR